MAAAGNTKPGWELDKAVLPNFLNVNSQTANAFGMFFSPDGLNLYIGGDSSVFQYVLSTAWLVSTATYTRSFTYTNSIVGVHFNTAGTKMFIINPNHLITEYTVSTPWNISTLTYGGEIQLYSYDTSPQDLFFSSDGTIMYTLGSTTDSVYQFTLGSAWSLSSVTYVQSFSVTAQDTTPTGLFFKADGTRMYVVGSTGDDINEYSLSTPWDISTATYVRVSLALTETNPQALFFKPDGTKMYLIGSTYDQVAEYDLLTAWNVNTLASVGTFSPGFDTGPTGIFFKPDGSRMFLYGFGNDKVYSYNLSTAWNISTASYYQQLSLKNLDEIINDIYIRPDGKKLYAVGSTIDAVFEINL